MSPRTTATRNIEIILTLSSLAGVFAYVFWHTGGFLARYVDIPLIGYAAAWGIDSAIVLLSWRIGRRLHAGQQPGWFYPLLILVVVVSGVANLSEGFHTKYARELTISELVVLDPLTGAFWFLSTAVMSAVSLALSEIIASDVRVVSARTNVTERVERAQITAPVIVEQELPHFICARCGKVLLNRHAAAGHERWCGARGNGHSDELLVIDKETA